MSAADVLFIVNPASGNGKTGVRWSGIQAHMQTVGLQFDSALTRAPNHAIVLVREALERGVRTIVTIGGDGTVNEVINGVMLAGDGNPAQTSQVRLGFVGSGTGTDFLRTLAQPKDLDSLAARLTAGETARFDAGYVTCARAGGQTAERYFVNVAGLGYDGEVADRANRSSVKALGPRLSYLATVIGALATYRNKPVRVTLDGQTRAGVWNSVIVANGQYFGGGMRVAPNAAPHDGTFDVIILADMTRLEFLSEIPKVYSGRHLDHPKVLELRAREVQVEADAEMFLEADGDLVGEAPASFRIIPGALSVIV